MPVNPDVLFGDNPLWDLIANSESFTELRKSAVKVMLTELEHERLTLQTIVAGREVAPGTGYEEHTDELEEKAVVLRNLLNELETEDEHHGT